ncbi:MAG: glycosyltransferase [Bradymonadaceae bacterium]
MDLGVDALGIRRKGGATVLLGVVSGALQHPSIDRVVVFAASEGGRDFKFPDAERLTVVSDSLAHDSYAARIGWYEWGLERAARRHGVDGVLCLNGMGRTRSVPHVTYVQQSLPFSREASGTFGTFERVQIAIIGRMMGRSTRSAAGVITQTRPMVESVHRKFDISRDRIDPVMPSVQLPEPEPLDENILDRLEDSVPGKRVLYVGNDQPYKRLGTLKAAAELLHSRSPQSTVFLAGPEPSQSWAGTSVEVLGFVERSQLRHLYDSTDVFVIPSLVESCPLPVLEAMSRGLPVVAADRPYARAVAGSAGRYVDPNDASAFAGELAALVEDPDFRTRRSEAARLRFEAIKEREPTRELMDIVLRRCRPA